MFLGFLVDGFAGGGLYTDEETGSVVGGSPLVISDAVGQAMAEIALTRTKPPTLNCALTLVDNYPDTIAHLRHTLRHHPIPPFVQTKIVEKSFDSAITEILGEIAGNGKGKPRAIFLLDQYAYSDVTLKHIQLIFDRIAGAEVVMTFGTDILLNYLRQNDKSLERLEHLGLSRPDAQKVIDADRSNAAARAVVAQFLIGQIVSKTKARFFTPFFITSAKSRRSYWLVHLSNSVRARDEMTEVHWGLTNHFLHQGTAGLNMLGYDPVKDIGSQTKFPFTFDDDDKARVHNALMDDLPRLGCVDDEGTTFGDLITNICNETPATAKQVKQALISLQAEKDIEILTPTGANRRAGSGIVTTDLVRRKSQFHLQF